MRQNLSNCKFREVVINQEIINFGNKENLRLGHLAMSVILDNDNASLLIELRLTKMKNLSRVVQAPQMQILDLNHCNGYSL